MTTFPSRQPTNQSARLCCTQGQRTLSLLCGKDLQQEGVVPAGDFAFSFDAVLGRVLLQQADRETAEPGEVVGQMPLARSALVFAERDVEHPVQ